MSRSFRSPATFSLALTVGLLACQAPASASFVVLNNLDQAAEPTAASPFVGQSFLSGIEQTLIGARMQLDPGAPPSSAIQLEVEARNFDGTVGATLFSDFTSSYDASTGIVTFLANSRFDFAAETSYWLVLSDPESVSVTVTWSFTSSQIYQSDFGYGLPSYNTAYYSDQNNGQGNATYYQPSDGPQMFQLITTTPTVVPEPPAAFSLALGLAAGALALRSRSRMRRDRRAFATETD